LTKGDSGSRGPGRKITARIAFGERENNSNANRYAEKKSEFAQSKMKKTKFDHDWKTGKKKGTWHLRHDCHRE